MYFSYKKILFVQNETISEIRQNAISSNGEIEYKAKQKLMN